MGSKNSWITELSLLIPSRHGLTTLNRLSMMTSSPLITLWVRKCRITSTDGCASVIPAITPKAGTGKRTWKENLYKYACPESVLSYDIFTDYLAATDQRAKNMQPMWFLEEYASVTDGVYRLRGCHAHVPE